MKVKCIGYGRRERPNGWTHYRFEFYLKDENVRFRHSDDEIVTAYARKVGGILLENERLYECSIKEVK